MNKYYQKAKEYLKKHQKISFVLSHGGLHICVLLLLLIIFISLICVYNYYKPSYRVGESKITLVDNPNVPLSHLNISIFPDTINKGLSVVSIKPLYSKVWGLNGDSVDSKVKWSWRNSGKTNLSSINYPDSLGIEVEKFKKGFDITFPSLKMVSLANLSTGGNMIAMERNPYIDFFFKLDFGKYDLAESSKITLDFTQDENEIIVFKHIYPAPTKVGINKIEFSGKEDVENVLENGGLYVSAENAVRAKKHNNLFLIISILGGTTLAFMLDIIITLIYKWRRL